MNFEYSIVIYTNYIVNFTIINQIKFTSNNVDKLNFKFVRAFIYLSQFRLRVFHRIDKFNVISNILSRLFTIRHNSIDVKIDNLNIESFHAEIEKPTENAINKILIEMSNDFRKKFIIDYQTNFN